MSVFVAGDVCLGECFDWDVSELRALIRNEPLVINLEGAVLGRAPTAEEACSQSKFNLYSTVSAFGAFCDNFNVKGVVLANNHACDFDGGLEATLRFLAERNIAYCGTRSNTHLSLEVGDKEFLFYSFVSSLTEVASIARAKLNVHHRGTVENVRACCNDHPGAVVVVTPHWGYELQTQPQNADVELADQLLLAGASYVIGHHPHVIQDSNDSRRIYSVGNMLVSQGPYLGKRLVYSAPDAELFYVAEITEDGRVLKHLFRTVNKAFHYVGVRRRTDPCEVRKTPRGYPSFSRWGTASSCVQLALIAAKRAVRAGAIALGLHRPYNWRP